MKAQVKAESVRLRGMEELATLESTTVAMDKSQFGIRDPMNNRHRRAWRTLIS